MPVASEGFAWDVLLKVNKKLCHPGGDCHWQGNSHPKSKVTNCHVQTSASSSPRKNSSGRKIIAQQKIMRQETTWMM